MMPMDKEELYMRGLGILPPQKQVRTAFEIFGSRPVPKIKNVMDKIEVLENKIDALTRKLDLIFGSAVLLNGEFHDIQNVYKKD